MSLFPCFYGIYLIGWVSGSRLGYVRHWAREEIQRSKREDRHKKEKEGEAMEGKGKGLIIIINMIDVAVQ